MSLKSWVTEIPKKEIVVPLSYYYSSESETSCKPSVTTKERRKEELISWWLFSSSSNSKLVLQISPTSSLKTCQNQNFAAFSVSVSLSLSLCEVSGNFPTNNKLSINHWEASAVCLLYCCFKLSFNLLLIMCGKMFWICESKSVDWPNWL